MDAIIIAHVLGLLLPLDDVLHEVGLVRVEALEVALPAVGVHVAVARLRSHLPGVGLPRSAGCACGAACRRRRARQMRKRMRDMHRMRAAINNPSMRKQLRTATSVRAGGAPLRTSTGTSNSEATC